MPGVSGVSAVSVLPFGARGGVNFDLAAITFAPSMAKRATKILASAPICEGHWDGTGTPDVVSFPRGAQLGNPTGVHYANFDPVQGAISFWVTPEWDGNDNLWHVFPVFGSSGVYVAKNTSNNLGVWLATGVNLAPVDISAWTAGTTYFVVIRWDSKRTLDGTNYACISVNDVHTFGRTSSWTPSAPGATCYLGVHPAAVDRSAQAIIEGLTIFGRPLWDGAYGVDLGNGDEIALIYAAGAGADPTTITGGSWDIPFCLPTDSTPGALVTGPGEAWSHPLESGSIGENMLADDGGYLGGPYAVTFDGTNDQVDYGSDATIDNIPGGQSITVEGRFRVDVTGAVHFLGKFNGTVGWTIQINASNEFSAFVVCATTTANSEATAASYGVSTFADGKWHHFVGVYDDTGDKTIYLAFDGRWPSAYDTQVAGVDAYQSDAALSLFTGERNGASQDLTGAHGWLRLSDNRRYTPGTDFIAPLTLPAADGNTIEQWTVAQGTGNLTAVVTSPNNDGVRTGATWEAQWDQDTSPVIPISLEFYAEDDGINFLSGVNIDDLPLGDCTIEFWARINEDTTDGTILISKRPAGNTGWLAAASGVNRMRFTFNFDNTDAIVDCNAEFDGTWHHYAADWDQGTLTLRSFLDGVFDETDTAVGNYAADAAGDCLVNAAIAIGTGDGKFAIGPIRLSNNRRYTGTYFVPTPRTNWMANDGNAHLITRMNDGAGATVTDYSGNGYNGTVTFGATTKWHNTPDMEIDCPGGRIFHGGYSIGADAANDGFTQVVTGLTPGDDYVVRVPVTWDPDVVAQPEIGIYDEIGAAAIVRFLSPLMTGVHTGANNLATLISAGARFTQSLIGATLDNVTDGSTTTVTAISGDGTTVTGVLAGGTDNDWDTNDVFRFRWADSIHRHPWCETFTFTLPALCTSISIQTRNLNDEGMSYVHQVEVIPSLLVNGDHELFGPIAASRTVTIGTETGVLANSYAQDGVIWTINELAIPGPSMQVEINFTVQAGMEGANIRMYGRYNGNPAHTVNVDVWNYNTTVWDNLGVIAHNPAYANHTWAFTVPAQQTNGTNILIRFNHISNGTVGHTLDFDYIWIETDTAIIRGWTNVGLDVGDTEQEAVVVHSGAEAMQWNVGASGEYMYYAPTVVAQQFVMIGHWYYGDGTERVAAGPRLPGTDGHIQYSLTVNYVPTPTTAVWSHVSGVFKMLADTTPNIQLFAFAGAAGNRYTDDVYLVSLDPVTLTVTPASEANSLEAGGIRIDGLDQAPQVVPVGDIGPNAGDIRWNWGPRHGDTESVLFGNAAPTVMIIWGDANNYAYVSWSAADTLTLLYNANGAGIQTANWATGGAFFVPDAQHSFRVRWNAVGMVLFVDGVARITIVAATGFVWPAPTTVWWGTSRVGINQVDAVYS